MSDDSLIKDADNKSSEFDDVVDLLMDDFAKKNNIPTPVAEQTEETSQHVEEEQSSGPAETENLAGKIVENKVEQIQNSNNSSEDETLPFEFAIDVPADKNKLPGLGSLVEGEGIDKFELKAPDGTSFEVTPVDLGDDPVADEYVDYDDIIEEIESTTAQPVVTSQPEPEPLQEEPVTEEEQQVNFALHAKTEAEPEPVVEPDIPEIREPKDSPINSQIAFIMAAGGSVLDKICESKLSHIQRQKNIISEERLRDSINLAPPPRGFLSAINSQLAIGKDALIAEIKRASPSKGIIREDFDPSAIAKAYEAAGATCISVLTDQPYFQGRDEYLHMVAHASKLPILRKDFILDEYQVVESRALGADCILLIMAALTIDKAKELEALAMALGMDVLVEVHNEAELQLALQLKTMLIGINNRDLKSLKIDLAITEKLAPKVEFPKTVVCESGIYSYQDILRMNDVRVKTFLVGESLMVQDDIELATQRLLGANND